MAQIGELNSKLKITSKLLYTYTQSGKGSFQVLENRKKFTLESNRQKNPTYYSKTIYKSILFYKSITVFF